MDTPTPADVAPRRKPPREVEPIPATVDAHIEAARQWTRRAEAAEATDRYFMVKHYAAIATAHTAIATVLATQQPVAVEAVDPDAFAAGYVLEPQSTPVFERDFPDNVMWGTQAFHNTGELSRDEGGFFTVTGESRHNYIGNWLTGFGFVDVRFPKHTTRPLTAAERDRLANSQVVIE